MNNLDKYCPICFEIIGCEQNCTITECRHTFHTTCIIQNVIIIGIRCPLCRINMFPMIPGKNDEKIEHVISEHLETETTTEPSHTTLVNIQEPPPTSFYIADKLLESGITFEYMLRALLLEHDVYDNIYDEYDRVWDDIYNKIKNCIDNYNL